MMRPYEQPAADLVAQLRKDLIEYRVAHRRQLAARARRGLPCRHHRRVAALPAACLPATLLPTIAATSRLGGRPIIIHLGAFGLLPLLPLLRFQRSLPAHRVAAHATRATLHLAVRLLAAPAHGSAHGSAHRSHLAILPEPTTLLPQQLPQLLRRAKRLQW